MKPYIRFKRKDKISCENIRFKTILWEYICWKLAGKPDGHYVGYEKK
tara:strand:- start:87 stop:227 length:141 start_codon:yes stop_codon:yes gene_type:complete